MFQDTGVTWGGLPPSWQVLAPCPLTWTTWWALVSSSTSSVRAAQQAATKTTKCRVCRGHGGTCTSAISLPASENFVGRAIPQKTLIFLLARLWEKGTWVVLAGTFLLRVAHMHAHPMAACGAPLMHPAVHGVGGAGTVSPIPNMCPVWSTCSMYMDNGQVNSAYFKYIIQINPYNPSMNYFRGLTG